MPHLLTCFTTPSLSCLSFRLSHLGWKVCKCQKGSYHHLQWCPPAWEMDENQHGTCLCRNVQECTFKSKSLIGCNLWGSTKWCELRMTEQTRLVFHFYFCSMCDFHHLSIQGSARPPTPPPLHPPTHTPFYLCVYVVALCLHSNQKVWRSHPWP